MKELDYELCYTHYSRDSLLLKQELWKRNVSNLFHNKYKSKIHHPCIGSFNVYYDMDLYHFFIEYLK